VRRRLRKRAFLSIRIEFGIFKSLSTLHLFYLQCSEFCNCCKTQVTQDIFTHNLAIKIYYHIWQFLATDFYWPTKVRYCGNEMQGMQSLPWLVSKPVADAKYLLFAILCVKYCVWHGPKFRRHKVMTILLWQPVWRCYLMCHDQKKMQQVSRKRWKDPSMASIWLLPAWGVLVTSLRVGGI